MPLDLIHGWRPVRVKKMRPIKIQSAVSIGSKRRRL
jgi:hypothetical protein